MRPQPRFRPNDSGARGSTRLRALATFAVLAMCLASASLRAQQKAVSKHPRQLDRGIVWHRDPATGELHADAGSGASSAKGPDPSAAAAPLRAVTQMVPVSCIVSAADGSAIPGLRRDDF